MQVCLLGCGISTGWGAVYNTAKVQEGSSAAVFGIGAVGLAVIEALVAAGATRIIAVDTNPEKEAVAREWGATDFINPKAHLYTAPPCDAHSLCSEECFTLTEHCQRWHLSSHNMFEIAR